MPLMLASMHEDVGVVVNLMILFCGVLADILI